MKSIARRLIVFAGFGSVAVLLSRPVPLPGADDVWTAADYIDSLSGATLLLALIAALLLWRHRQLRLQLGAARQQLARERSLRARAEQALQDKHASLCRQAALHDGVRENERLRIARDVHDDLGQHLLSLKIDISMLQLRGALPPQANQKLGLIARNLDRTVQSLRCIINDLRPAALEDGLRAAVDWQLGEFARLSGIACTLEVGADFCQDGARPDLELVVFRILQESLSNILRHARASAVHVTLARTNGGLFMKVSDNGVGMPAGANRGCGLLGMEQRVRAVGGWFFIDSAPGQGATLSLSLPLHTPQAEPTEAAP